MNKANRIVYLVVNKDTLKSPSYWLSKNSRFDTLAGAKRSCTAVNKKIARMFERELTRTRESAKAYASKHLKGARATAFVTQSVAEARKKFEETADAYVVMDSNEFAAADVMVETYNMLNPNGGKVMICKSQLGGCCDPATETYHSM